MLVAGIYGVLHDQITHFISPSYYTKLKFDQFNCNPATVPTWLCVSKVGFLATYWLGIIAGWLIGRLSYVDKNRSLSFKRASFAMLYLIITAVITAVVFSLSFQLFGDKTNTLYQDHFHLTDEELSPFLHVGAIHLGSYVGGLIGLTWVLIMLFTQNLRRKKHDTHLQEQS